jgi:hypothetical protein
MANDPVYIPINSQDTLIKWGVSPLPADQRPSAGASAPAPTPPQGGSAVPPAPAPSQPAAGNTATTTPAVD